MLQPGPWMVELSLADSSMPAVTQVPGCTAKMGAWQSSFSPAEEIDLGHRSFNTEMGSGLSGSMKRVRERVGARIPASSHTWLSPGALAGCWLSHTWGLCLVGDDAADEVGLGGAQVGHQLVEIFLQGRHRG